MKKFRFLLLDAGPIIKLFELGIWDTFIRKCDVTITRTVANEAKYASQDFEDICIDLDSYEGQALINIEEISVLQAKSFLDRFRPTYREQIHDGEKETLAFLCDSPKNWLVCAADKVVFRVLGLLGRGDQGISLEEVLKEIGHSRSLEPQYAKKYRERWTHKGQVDFIQNQALL